MKNRLYLWIALVSSLMILLTACQKTSSENEEETPAPQETLEENLSSNTGDSVTEDVQDETTEVTPEATIDPNTLEETVDAEPTPGPSYDYDPTIDLDYRRLNEYGTTSPFGDLSVMADTDSSIVVDWRNEPNVDPGSKQFTDAYLMYKSTTITDGNALGDSIDLEMHIQYHPDANQPSPVVLFIPGGGFSTAQVYGLPLLRDSLANAGYALVAAQYRVIGEGLYKDAVADANDAIRYIKANAETYNLDPNAIALLGNSAGGYMVSLTATSSGDGNPDFMGENNLEYTTDVQAVINLYGLSDLTKIGADYTEASIRSHEVNTSPESHYVNGVFSNTSIMEDPETATASNPLAYIDGSEPPFLMMHGNQDLAVSPSQTLILHEALREAGLESTRYVLDGANHGRGGFDSQPALDVILDFLEAHLQE